MAKYDLLRIIGEGTSAVSYLAEDEAKQQVLVKRFKSAIYRNESDFNREINVLRSLQHPQIPSYIDSYIEQIDGRSLPHIVQEFIQGESLQTQLSRQRPTQDQALEWLQQLLGILSYLHALIPPVIHRDIKPSNILLRDGQIVLIDFGLAVDDKDRSMGYTIGVGTLGYQAPEQISGEPTIRSDLYSTGAMAVEMLIGRSPSTMLTGTHLRWEEKCIHLATPLQKWLDRMLAFDATQRFANAQEANEALPLVKPRVEIVHNALRKPTKVKVSDSFLARLQAKQKVKKEQYTDHRRQQLAKQEAERQAQEAHARKTIIQERKKQEAERHRQQMERLLDQREATLLEELEQSFAVCMSMITGKTLEPQDALDELSRAFSDRRVLTAQGFTRQISHPLLDLCDNDKRSYRKWVLSTKAAEWEKQDTVIQLDEEYRFLQLQIDAKSKEISNLGYFAGVFQKRTLKQEQKALQQRLAQNKLQRAEQQKIFRKHCLEVYWKPFDYDLRSRTFGKEQHPHEMIFIPSDDHTGHNKGTVSQDFWLGKYAVTQEFYTSVMGNNPSEQKGFNQPVENVSWCDAVLFCNKLSQKEGLQPVYTIPVTIAERCAAQTESRDKTIDELAKRITINETASGYRLPTEDEWEYAARGGDAYSFSGSNSATEVGWFHANSGKKTNPVGQKKANGFGFHDMSGNVWEWTWDAYGSFHRNTTTNAKSSLRVYRGGGWRDNPVEVNIRGNGYPSLRNNHVGFRVLRSL